ncbi:NAD-glutamate dehydrogenase [Candidatus Phycosocius spiralis]|uniref:Glutamate dehydrogenase n=1 Tax=Candidatus Phycosocius spiralis TaxID=2815099 RepID=A0ABQ4PXR4_9PROT|nr:NAD-glutamate dehydrogenase [Candidatus Phycosocius spiralis]GIU67817.1 glutamate dehydrogenase [Candidatus Phycosocius spiralis]
MSVDATDRRISPDDLILAALAFDSFKTGAHIDAAAESFLTQIAQDATTDDVAGLSPEDLAALADGFWRWTSHKRADAQHIRLVEAKGADGRPLKRDLLEICGPDMPFLVDSVMGEIGAQGVDVRAMFHPVVAISRDGDGMRVPGGVPQNESLIQVHLPTTSPSKRDALLTGVRETLQDVRLSVGDFHAMKQRMSGAIQALSVAKTRAKPDEVIESIAFLKWLTADHFVFFGVRSYDYPRDKNGAWIKDEPDIREDLNLGILRDPLRMVLRRLNEPSVLSDAVRAYIEEPAPVIVAKSNLRSRVHRRTVMDYIGVKRFGENGEVLGEDRFVGLFTAEAYDQMVRDVPLLRIKTERVITRAGLVPGSHNDKRLRNIVENYPRDELFQIDEADLARIALGVQHLMDRPRTKLFVRQDRFDRFLSILVFVPRDRYNSEVRAKIGDMLAEAYAGRLSAYYPLFGDAPLARVHYIIGVTANQHANPDVEELEKRIAEITRTWEDGLEVAGEGKSHAYRRYLGGIPAGYKERFGAEEALRDIVELDQIKGDEVRVRAYRRPGDHDNVLRAKLYKAGNPTPLSAAVPIFESMGLYVESETPHCIMRSVNDQQESMWVQDVSMHIANNQPLDFKVVEGSFEQAVAAIWAGQAENDGFNRLILKLGVSWREAALVRALARWRGQTGLDPSEGVQQQAVGDYPDITRAILTLFTIRFDPDFGTKKTRESAAKAQMAAIKNMLDHVPSLDADRVLRRLADLVMAMVRTNYYQPDTHGAHKSYMSFKIATRELEDVPDPKPYREIWIWSPQVEGAHLRFGPVARGGLRWSDRRDDFRTEVLGLVKAQQVKNAVIVPVGSKGAFYPKTLPQGSSRDDIQSTAIEAYKTFLRGLLDLTDNIAGDGTIVPPKNVVRWDSDDPYLVVAADKGTATFSDIANGISAEYSHWLGDAFASGGSVGYDHKKMGITARGGWEAVKRHFREIGHDTQTQPFSVIGVGDMSGDVFGNAMLLSQQIKLVAAFDHRDIFIDPQPDLAKSFKERARLFALPRSSWADYNAKLISPGGGVYSRSAKSIPLSPQLKSLTGLEGDQASPTDIMHALLKAPCDLLWFGGIGTYVKARSESHNDAGDKANDIIRVDGEELRCKVIGEGANLGLTQRGRIAAAHNGVRLNTDAIDNSAGVDSSDHEVNIKILLTGLVRSGTMTLEARDTLLAQMTDDVARHVLAHNYSQTLAISLQEATARQDLDAHERFIEHLEASGRLARKVEFLPTTEEFRARRANQMGLTRPELSVLTAYGKLALFDDLIASDAPDDPWFEETLVQYFPEGCRQFKEAMANHRLRREIIATVLSNKMVDLGGACFMDRVRESAAADTGSIARAFAAARAIFGLDQAIEAVNALDLIIPANVQLDLMLEILTVLRRQSFWLARKASRGDGAGVRRVGDLVDTYANGVQTLAGLIDDVVSPFEKARLASRCDILIAAGAPAQLAKSIACLLPLTSATDIVDIASAKAMQVDRVARLYHALGASVGFDEIRAAANQTSTPDHWDRVATRRLIEEFMGEQSALTASVCEHVKAMNLMGSDAAWARAAMESWTRLNGLELGRTSGALAELRASQGGWSFAKLAIANNQLKELTQTAKA